MEIQIQSISTEQVEHLGNLVGQLAPYLSTYPDYIYLSLSDCMSEYLLGAFDGEQLVGYVAALPKEEGVFVMQIGVHPEYQGKKVAGMLLEELVKGHRFLECSICPDNGPSMNCFSSFAKRKGRQLVPTGKEYNGSIRELYYRIEGL